MSFEAPGQNFDNFDIESIPALDESTLNFAIRTVEEAQTQEYLKIQEELARLHVVMGDPDIPMYERRSAANQAHGLSKTLLVLGKLEQDLTVDK